jgi:Carboxypeptidase regulatory-like domain
MNMGLAKTNFLDKKMRSSVAGIGSFVWLGLFLLLWCSPAMAQSPDVPPKTEESPGRQLRVPEFPGSISGTIVDPSGAAVAGARVELLREDGSKILETLSGDDGQFSFGNTAPGPFQLTIAVDGFAAQTLSGTLHEGEIYNVPPIMLALAAKKTEVRVEVPRAEVAEEQIKEEEKQRVLGIVPNFYVTYVPNAAPLTTKQKFELAWKSSVDPVTFLLTGAIAGAQQANNVFSGYGQGAEGYAKRYGADYADAATSTFIGSALLPSLLKQDPRYFYKGSGSARSRILYAIANSVICKGDNGRWQANYSNILGSLASGGISNLYYPAQDRSGAGLTFENAAIEIGATAVANLLQEFVIRKLTPNVHSHDPAKP